MNHHLFHGFGFDREFDTSCTICLNDFKNSEPIVMTNCKHSFHKKCLESWIEKKINEVLGEVNNAD